MEEQDESQKTNNIDPEKSADTKTNLFQIDREIYNKIKSHQNFFYALLGGGLTAIICAIMWAGISIGTKHQIGYMAIAVGAFIGLSVRFFGAGIDKKFGILGAVLSLLGCLLGNLFAQVGFIAIKQRYGYFEALTYLDFRMILRIMSESFNPMDLLFYGIAIVEGYKFSLRSATEEVIENEGNSPYFKYRMPLVIVCTVILLFIYIKLHSGTNGEKTYTYPSGKIQAKGELKYSKNNGKWIFYYENGNIMSSGYFNMGARDSTWEWYDTDGKLESTGAFKNGLEEGSWIKYYENGNIMDSIAYTEGRVNGKSVSRYENGNLMVSGYYYQSKKNSLWESYYENGQLASTGKMKTDNYIGEVINYFPNGKIAEEDIYGPGNKVFIKNVWDTKGAQIVTNGNGFYETYTKDNGKLALSGEVKNGEKIGIWKTFSENGMTTEEGSYEDGEYQMINAWDNMGVQLVENGTGTYKEYYPDEKTLKVIVDIKNGLKTGTWEFHSQSGKLMASVEFIAGKQNGEQKNFFESGQIYTEGNLSDDQMVGTWKWYHENGNLSSSVQFYEGKKEGTQTFFDESGKKVKEEYYKNGELTGSKLFK